MKASWFVCLILLFSAPVAANVAEQLALIDQIKLDDTTRADTLLKRIDAEKLNAQQHEMYEYLSIYLSLFQGDIRQVYERLGTLASTAKSREVVIKSLTTRLGLTGYIGEWEAGFVQAAKLNKVLEQPIDHSLYKVAKKGLANFYNTANKNELALQIIQQLYREVTDDESYLCNLRVIELEARSESGELKSPDFDAVKDECDNAGSPFFVLYTETLYFYHLIETGDLANAQRLLSRLEQEVTDQPLVYLQVSFAAYKSKLQLLTEKVEAAKAAAVKTLEMDPSGEYLPSKIMALEVLLAIAKRSGDFRSALNYLEQLEQTRIALREEKIIKESAYQQARFELQLKENEIALLDERNRYLQAQSQLSHTRVQSSYVALAFVSIILLGVLIWAYRSTKLQQKLTRMAREDALTGISNRGYFLECVNKHLTKAQRDKLPCSLLLLDLDFFKRVNDTYGHQVGDWVLEQAVIAVKAQLDPGVEFGRMGGEEFAIFIRNANRHRAVALAERCREAISNVKTSESGHQFIITASFGVSDTDQVGYDYRNLSAASDLALYQSKQYGRNRVYEYETGLVGEAEEEEADT